MIVDLLKRLLGRRKRRVGISAILWAPLDLDMRCRAGDVLAAQGLTGPRSWVVTLQLRADGVYFYATARGTNADGVSLEVNVERKLWSLEP